MAILCVLLGVLLLFGKKQHTSSTEIYCPCGCDFPHFHEKEEKTILDQIEDGLELFREEKINASVKMMEEQEESCVHPFKIFSHEMDEELYSTDYEGD